MKSKMLFATAIVALLTAARLIPHEVNFTPVLAMALFSGFVFNKKVAWLPVLVSMLVVDLILGFHSTSLFVYASVTVIAFMSQFIHKDKSFLKTAIPTTLAASMVFYLLTNFGVWGMTPMYEKTLTGLLKSYVAGLPFLKNTLLSTYFYFFAAVGVFKLVEAASEDKVAVK